MTLDAWLRASGVAMCVLAGRSATSRAREYRRRMDDLEIARVRYVRRLSVWLRVHPSDEHAHDLLRGRVARAARRAAQRLCPTPRDG